LRGKLSALGFPGGVVVRTQLDAPVTRTSVSLPGLRPSNAARGFFDSVREVSSIGTELGAIGACDVDEPHTPIFSCAGLGCGWGGRGQGRRRSADQAPVDERFAHEMVIIKTPGAQRILKKNWSKSNEGQNHQQEAKMLSLA